MVMWDTSERDTWKLNADGSFLANKGKAGAGGVVRKGNGSGRCQ